MQCLAKLSQIGARGRTTTEHLFVDFTSSHKQGITQFSDRTKTERPNEIHIQLPQELLITEWSDGKLHFFPVAHQPASDIETIQTFHFSHRLLGDSSEV